jgi:hypothetical protein
MCKTVATEPVPEMIGLPGPEAQLIDEDFSSSTHVSLEWDPGGADPVDPLKQRPPAMYITAERDGKKIMRRITAKTMFELARTEWDENHGNHSEKTAGA